MLVWRHQRRQIDTALMAIAYGIMHQLARARSRFIHPGATETLAETSAHDLASSLCRTLLPGVPVYVHGRMVVSDLPVIGDYVAVMVVDSPSYYRASDAELDGLACLVMYVRDRQAKAVVVGDISNGELFALKCETGEVMLHMAGHTATLSEVNHMAADNKVVVVGGLRGFPASVAHFVAERRMEDAVLEIAYAVGPLSTFPKLWRTLVVAHLWGLKKHLPEMVMLAITSLNQALGMVTLCIEGQPPDVRFMPCSLSPWDSAAWPNHLVTVHASTVHRLTGMGH